MFTGAAGFSVRENTEETFTFKLLNATNEPFADRVDQDQTAQNVQSDLRSTLSDDKITLK